MEGGNLGIKRVRLWEACENVEDLKQMLAEKDSEVDDLKRKLKVAEKRKVASSPVADTIPITAADQKALRARVTLLKRSIASQVLGQMKYVRGGGTSKLSAIEMCDITEPILELLVGEEIFKQAPNTLKHKQVKIVLLPDDLEGIFNKKFSKTLRFGAALELIHGLTLTFFKSEGTLKITGAYKMVK